MLTWPPLSTRYLVCLLLFLALAPRPGWAQVDTDLPVHDDFNRHLLDRLDILGVQRSKRGFPTGLNPTPRNWARDFYREVDESLLGDRTQKWYQRARFLVDDAYAEQVGVKESRKRLKWLYPNRRDFLRYRHKRFAIYANPLLGLSLGHSQELNDLSHRTYQNTRGLSLRGHLFGKVAFYTEVTDNQTRLPLWQANPPSGQPGTLWGEGFVKPFGNDGFDYFNIRGYLTAEPIPELRIKFGRDRAFWGNGFQSLFLSDHATDYLLLNLTLRIWELEYSTQFTQFVDYIPNKPDAYGTHPRKYGAFHMLTWRPNRKFSLSVFESIIYAGSTPNASRGIELQYLNPLIFYRSIEQFIGSPDNAFLGLSFKANLLNQLQLYGQANLDDFNFAEWKNDRGYFGNKLGYQLGAKWINAFGVELLDLQAEHNSVRPYMYSHFNPASNYAHYGQPLAHARGANLRDFTAIGRYRPLSNLELYLRYTFTQQGLDSTGRNFGGDIFRSDITRDNGTDNINGGNTIAQGVLQNLHTLHLKLSYQIWDWYAFVEGELWMRRDQTGTQTAALLSLRLNLASKPVRF